jgi:replicative DNA helicase Mcm
VIRFLKLPESCKIKISDIRSKHLNKFLVLDGLVRNCSPVRPQVVSSKFECPACSAVFNVLQLDKKIKEPTRCGCGRKGKFTMISKELIDVQKVVLEECIDLLEGQQIQRITVLLNNDLTLPEHQRKISPGRIVRINGILTELPIILRSGYQSTQYEFLVKANSIENIEEEEDDLKITDKDKKEIISFSKQKDCKQNLIRSFAPSIYGCEKIKEGLILNLIGGEKEKNPDGTVIRGDMHTLLAGEPGLAKSQLLKYCQKIAPHSRYVSGKGSSAAGLTAAVVKDDLLGGWSLEAGAVVLANKSFCMIDEFDKLDQNDRSALHECMEQQTVSIAKANIQATLKAETTIIAACNPKHSKFDLFEENFAKQLEMPPSLLNRFDIIFKLTDVVNSEEDEALVDHIFTKKEAELPLEFLKKYIFYVRNKVHPQWTEEAQKLVKNWYVEVRKSANAKALPINPRQLNVLKRLATANAKLLRMSKILPEHVNAAKEILEFSLKQVGCMSEGHEITMDAILSTYSKKERVVLQQIKANKKISVEELQRSVCIAEEELNLILENLKSRGDIYEPSPGFLMAL